DDHRLCAGGCHLRRLRALHLGLADRALQLADRAQLVPDRRRRGLDRGDLGPQGNRARKARLMLIRFAGQKGIVAGAAPGTGRAVAGAFAADGADVIACDRLVDQIETGERITALPVDVTDSRSIDKVVAAAGGRVDVLAYVAGGVLGQSPKPLEQVTPEEFA